MAGGAQKRLQQSLHHGGEGKIQLPVLERTGLVKERRAAETWGGKEEMKGALF